MKLTWSSSLFLLSTATLGAANAVQVREPFDLPDIGSVVGDVTSVVVGGFNTLTSDVASVVTSLIEPEFTTLTSEVSSHRPKT
jgi:hypothetical protein